MVQVANGAWTHDVAVTNVTLTPTMVKPGSLVTINVTVLNNGTVAETFNVTAYYDLTHEIDTQTITGLAAGVEMNVIFTWNTTGLGERTYKIKVTASLAEDEYQANDSDIESVAITSTVLYVDLPLVTAEPGESFTVDINVINARNVYGYGFMLFWNDPVLNATDVTEGNFLKQGKYVTNFVSGIWNEPHSVTGVSGYIFVSNSLQKVGGEAQAHGNGTLCSVTFLVETTGASDLDLRVQPPLTYMLADMTQFETPHFIEDGVFIYPIPKLSVDPETLIDPSKGPGEVVTISVNITDAVNLYGFEFKLGYNATLLTATEVVTQPFLNTPYKFNFNQTDATAGYVLVNVTSDTPALPVNGSGTLATITFQIETSGACDLDLYDTTLLDANLIETLHVTLDGMFSNVKISSFITITPYPSSIMLGESVTLNGTITPEHPLAYVTIWYRLSGEETWNNLTVVQTDQDSKYVHVWEPQDPGDYEVKASWEGDAITESSESSVQTVEVQGASVIPFDILLYVVVIIVVVVAVIAVYFLRIRKTKQA